MKENRKKLVWAIIILLCCFNFLSWKTVYELNKQGLLRVVFFDIGQGDSIFIETPEKYQILIDGGPNTNVLEKLAKNMLPCDRTIDLVVLTHPDHDHIYGLIDVLGRYKVKNILWTGVIKDTSEYEKWENLIEKEKAKIFIANSEKEIVFPRVVLRILNPIESIEGEKLKKVNNTSIVIKLIFDDKTFLFTGDIFKSIERELVERYGEKIDSDVLKVAHHGSKTSSDEKFLETVSPEIAVISVEGNTEIKGEKCDNKERNRYGHPGCATLSELKKLKVEMFRTDEDGDISIVSDGKNLKIETKK
ncbi:MAG: MBL fold metallo-hydrolase [Patescibacteria group bacterium]|nr:MBL fold metallo-hydrolase [Patescibacteria group bacterium]